MGILGELVPHQSTNQWKWHWCFILACWNHYTYVLDCDLVSRFHRTVCTLQTSRRTQAYLIHQVQCSLLRAHDVWPAWEELTPLISTSDLFALWSHQSRCADSNQSLFRSAGALWAGGGLRALIGPPNQICHRGWAVSRRHVGPPVGTNVGGLSW